MSKQKKNEGSFFIRHKRALILTGSFLLPVLIFILVLITQGFYPFGSKTTVFMDLKDQYMEFLASLRNIGDADHSLLFSWSRSMGGNALGLYAYYSGGLLSFITCLFPVASIYAGVITLQILEIGLCGLSFAIFLEFGVFKNKGNLSSLAFGTAYALMSYNMVYTSCFMWLTGCIFLPLCLLGIERIIEKKRGLLFYLMLAGAMICNYYTAYMICLFSVMYFIFRMIGCHEWSKERRKETLKDIGKCTAHYAGMGILAAMTALPVILPVYMDLLGGKLAAAGSDVTGTNFNWSDLWHKFLPGQYDSITNEGALPSLYAGLICLVLAVLFLFCKKIRLKERIAVLFIPVILLISFWQKPFDCLWHGLQMPNWFPYRYAFLFGCIIVYMAARSYEEWSSLIKRIRIRTIVTGALTVLLSVELCLNAITCINGLGEQFAYMETDEYTDFIRVTEPLVKEAEKEDDTLFRIAKDYEFSKNDAMLLGYNGMTHYSSTYNAYINDLTMRLGLAQSWIWNSGYGATWFMDSLFGVRYRLAKHELPPCYESVDSKEDVTLYENPCALPFVYAAGQACLSVADLDGDVFTNQNTVCKALTGDDQDIFSFYPVEIAGEESDTTLSFTAADNNPVYLYLQPMDGYWGDIYVNDRFVSNYYSTETTCAVYLGTFAAGEPVKVSVRSDNAHFSAAWIVSMNQELVREKMEQLQKNGLQENSHGAGSLEGEITVSEGQVIATSVPYDEGYTVKIDGESVDYEPWLGTFLAVKTTPGTHTFSVSYTPKGFTIGLIAAAVAILLMAAYSIFFKKTVYKKDSL